MYCDMSKWKIGAIVLGMIDRVLWVSFWMTKEANDMTHCTLAAQGGGLCTFEDNAIKMH